MENANECSVCVIFPKCVCMPCCASDTACSLVRAYHRLCSSHPASSVQWAAWLVCPPIQSRCRTEHKHCVLILNRRTRISQKQHNSRRLTEESSQKRRNGHRVFIMRYATCARYTCSNPLPPNSMLARARGSWLCAIFSFRMTPPRACSLL